VGATTYFSWSFDARKSKESTAVESNGGSGSKKIRVMEKYIC